jgi:predicted nuclease of predicted toxin-antitoxin system
VRLRLDEMVPVRVARELRGAGFEVDAVVEQPALRGLADAQQLAEAAADGRALVTYDAADFIPLAQRRTASGEGHAGLILLRSSRFPQANHEELLDRLRAFLEGPAPPAEFVHWLD